jgi:hypothetical protein
MAFIGALVDTLTLLGVIHLTVPEKTAILAVASSAVALGVALYSLFTHQVALAKMVAKQPG